MDSKKRSLEIRIWDKPFFSDFNQAEKLFWWFVNTKCDNVGVYQHNCKLAEFHCGGELDLNSFVKKIGSSEYPISFLDESTLWLEYFVRETWGTLSTGNNLGPSCYKLLVKHGLLEEFISKYPNCINKKAFLDSGFTLPQVKDKPGAKDQNKQQIQGQTKASADAINISINEDISSILINKFKKINRNVLQDISDIALEGHISKTLEILEEKGIDDPVSYLIQKADEMVEKYESDKDVEKEFNIEEFLFNINCESVDDIPF
ncbi:hypothetical protein CK503_04155 [Aliifodinibius salipaludis]|uniref:Uncharacterized protein n=1 Tax=Fodinibius salipaludis TaxID=2032627 RepID=A0A2A2GCL2_9BACT|nr:hypothetical protein [Aliifodinibius salipaludis]PAU95396.1 hypothetical protein CK503_04155 [Aliifodinibius salipaludis]